MPQTRKQEPGTAKPVTDKTPDDKARDGKTRNKREAREDAEASRQDRPGTSLPAQRERWEDEGGAPGGVLSSTDATEPEQDKQD